MTKKVLIINGHASKDSLNYALAEAYKKGAETNNVDVKLINIADLNFEPFMKGFKKEIEPEPDIQKAQELISWANHLVWVYPTWWATMPAIMKAFIEQTFLPDFAFKYKKSKKIVKWDKYLIGKSARIISTMDSPPWYYKLFIGDPGYKTIKDIMNFCGIKPVKRTYFGSVKLSNDKQIKQWIKKAEELGKSLK